MFSLQINISLAQEDNLQTLDGVEIDYTYTNGNNVIFSFYDGMVRYRWITGPSAGISNEGPAYISREISDDIYFVNWQMKGWYVDFVINFNTNRLYASTLRGYGTEEQSSSFGSAVLNRVDR